MPSITGTPVQAPKHTFIRKLPFLALLPALLVPDTAALAASCESLVSLALPGAAITSAQLVARGVPTGLPKGPVFAQADPITDTPAFEGLPAFCRVAATLKPSGDSDIKIEVWLPVADWNEKYEAVGNGGWGGSIGYEAMAYALKRGYAASATDTGHSGLTDASFALGHPEKLIDFAYRSEHEMVLKAKSIITAFYGRSPRFSYWNSCSSGGKQGLKEAQRYPEDFDGIVAGSPSGNWTGRVTLAVWIAQAVHGDDAAYIPPSKYPLIHNAVLQACDARDGVKDGVLEDPRRCQFDPKILTCAGADTANCLTPAQVEAARKIYSSVVDPRTKKEIVPGLEPGSELGWAVMAGPRLFGNAGEHFKYIVFKDPKWDYRTFNFDRDASLAETVDHGTIDATDPNLKPFFAHGGKLLQYHGWNDWQIAPRSSVQYYESVLKTVGASTPDSYRLFMVPGMGHCGGGEGPNRFYMLSALEQWVEHGQAPERVVASRKMDGGDRTRPLCPYPQVAKYKGTGSTDEAANFTCAVPDNPISSR